MAKLPSSTSINSRGSVSTSEHLLSFWWCSYLWVIDALWSDLLSIMLEIHQYIIWFTKKDQCEIVSLIIFFWAIIYYAHFTFIHRDNIPWRYTRYCMIPCSPRDPSSFWPSLQHLMGWFYFSCAMSSHFLNWVSWFIQLPFQCWLPHVNGSFSIPLWLPQWDSLDNISSSSG